MTQLDTKRIPRRIIIDCLVLVLGTAVMIAISPSADPVMSGLQTYLTAFHAKQRADGNRCTGTVLPVLKISYVE